MKGSKKIKRSVNTHKHILTAQLLERPYCLNRWCIFYKYTSKNSNQLNTIL